MSILGDPLFSHIPPLRRHFIYGVNCYHFAANDRRIPVFTDAANPTHYRYMKLSPGYSAQKLSNCFPWTINKDDYTRILTEGCIEDGMTRLEDTSSSIAINIPKKNRLIAMLIDADEKGFRDFHFYALNPDTALWEDKLAFHDTRTRTDLVPRPADRFKLAQLFVAPLTIKSKSIPRGGTDVEIGEGYSLHFIDYNPTLNGIIEMEDHPDCLISPTNGRRYTKPAWPSRHASPP